VARRLEHIAGEKGSLAVGAAGLQGLDVAVHHLFAQGVDEPQDQGDDGEADDGGHAGDGVDAVQDGGVLLGGGGVADHAQQSAHQASREGLAQFPGEGVDGVDGAVLADAVLDLAVVDDVGDHGPDDGVEQAQAGISDGVEAQVDPAAFRMQDEADQVDDGAEQGADDSGLLLADLGSQHGGQRGHDEQRSDGRAHGHSGLGGGVLEVVGEDVGVHAGHGEHGQQQAQGRQDDAQQRTAGEDALEQGHGLELFGLGGDDDALGGQVEAEDVADD